MFKHTQPTMPAGPSWCCPNESPSRLLSWAVTPSKEDAA
jgi:hypothetical protein